MLKRSICSRFRTFLHLLDQIQLSLQLHHYSRLLLLLEIFIVRLCPIFGIECPCHLHGKISMKTRHRQLVFSLMWIFLRQIVRRGLSCRLQHHRWRRFWINSCTPTACNKIYERIWVTKSDYAYSCIFDFIKSYLVYLKRCFGEKSFTNIIYYSYS